jgi:hypothetical protein
MRSRKLQTHRRSCEDEPGTHVFFAQNCTLECGCCGEPNTTIASTYRHCDVDTEVLAQGDIFILLQSTLSLTAIKFP